MDVRIESGWHRELADQWELPYFQELAQWVREQYRAMPGSIFPPAGKVFAAFDACPFAKTKVVILGQDPYHGPGQANGLSFSVNPGIPLPPSLQNIFREVHDDTGAPLPADGDLTRWARQGVLLLNSSLTVEIGRAGSHQGHGWERFTDAAVAALNVHRDHLVFILWGAYAIRKGELIDRSRHMVLTSPHPSPLSAHKGFFGNHHFSRANAYLTEHGQTPIIW